MPQKQAQSAACARGKRKPAHRGEINGAFVARELRDDDHDGATFKYFLHCPERINGARHLEYDQPIHGKPETIETGPIRRAGFGARKCTLNPDHLSALRLRKRCERERKPRGSAGMRRKRRGKFVQRAKRQTAAKCSVDRVNPQAQRTRASFRESAGRIDLGKAVPQTMERIRSWYGIHGRSMFLLCSH